MAAPCSSTRSPTCRSSTQGKILRVLTDQSFTRVGGQRTVKVDMRVVSSTARNLPDEIAAGRFREDLYYRLNVVPVHLPALADRREDIPEHRRPFRRALRRRAAGADAARLRRRHGGAPGL